VIGEGASDFNISVDQNGRLITRLEERRSLRIGDVVVLDQQ
jgi:hypothetical protein